MHQKKKLIQQFPKLKRFLEEAKNAIKTIINKLKGTKDLTKRNKALIRCLDSSDIRALEEAKKYVNDPRLPNSYKKDLLEEIRWAEQHINNNTGDYTMQGLGFIQTKNQAAKEYIESQDRVLSCDI